MNRVTFVLALVMLSNVSGLALACKGRGGGYRGGYRAPSRSYGYAAPPVCHRPMYPPVIRQPFQQPPVQSARPISISPQAPFQAGPTQPVQPAPRNQQAPQVTQQPNNRQNGSSSALALLGGQSNSQPAQRQPLQQQPQQQQPQQQQLQHVGSWTASTATGATITLNLNGNGAFNWVANSNGKTSRFDGQFTIADGTLTLARSSDNQKLSGRMTFSGNGFNFKLNGANDGGLNFSQQS